MQLKHDINWQLVQVARFHFVVFSLFIIKIFKFIVQNYMDGTKNE